MTKLGSYAGRTAMVTGAGDGIGKMLAVKLAEAGMTVCVQDIREEAAATVALEIGRSAFSMTFDISDRDAVALAAQHFANEHGDLAMLWINAGVGVGASVLEGGPDQVRWAYDVNVLGAIWTAQCFVPLLNTEIWDGAKARPERFGGERRIDPKIAGMWREAKTPDAMWPDIERVMAAGGGTLVCATDAGETRVAMRQRIDAIENGLVEI